MSLTHVSNSNVEFERIFLIGKPVVGQSICIPILRAKKSNSPPTQKRTGRERARERERKKETIWVGRGPLGNKPDTVIYVGTNQQCCVRSHVHVTDDN